MNNNLSSEDQMKALMQRVREEAMRRKGIAVPLGTRNQGVSAAPIQAAAPQSSSGEIGADAIEAKLPEPIQLYLPDIKSNNIFAGKGKFKPNAHNTYRIGDFLGFDDTDFIDIAYRGLLGRLPDREGQKHYLAQLREGTDKVDILCWLRFSPEGKRFGATVVGLERARTIRKMFHLPVVGRFVRIATMLWGLEKTQRAQRVALGKLIRNVNEAQNIRQELVYVMYRALRVIENHNNELRQFAAGRVGQSALVNVASQGVVAANALNASVVELQQSIEALREKKADLASVDSVRNELDYALGEGLKRLTQSIQELATETVDRSTLKDVVGGKADLSQLEALRTQIESCASLQEELHAHIYRENHPLQDAMYAGLEDKFRGSREDIKSRQRIYLRQVRDAEAGTSDLPIIDLGCGRGEWLELLREDGLIGFGADENHIFIQGCQALGLNVEGADAIDFLQRRGAATVGGVTAFHLIEHLPFGKMIALFDETLRVLAPRGIAIFETPNPANLQVGANTFYYDPTHRNPLPAPLVQHLLEARGFVSAEIVALHPYSPDAFLSDMPPQSQALLNQLLFGARDYAVIARKG